MFIGAIFQIQKIQDCQFGNRLLCHSLLQAHSQMLCTIIQLYLPDDINVHAHLIHDSLDTPQSPFWMADQSVQPFVQGECRTLPTVLHNLPPPLPAKKKLSFPLQGPGLSSNTWYIRPTWPTTKIASWSSWPFFHNTNRQTNWSMKQ